VTEILYDVPADRFPSLTTQRNNYFLYRKSPYVTAIQLGVCVSFSWRRTGYQM